MGAHEMMPPIVAPSVTMDCTHTTLRGEVAVLATAPAVAPASRCPQGEPFLWCVSFFAWRACPAAGGRIRG